VSSLRGALATALEPAKLAAFPPGEFVGQEGFMTAREIRRLAHRAGIGPDDSVLDLCCGVGGPGRLVAAESRCRYLGLDRDPLAVAAARRATGDLRCRFDVAGVPPLPPGPYDVVLLLETLLAFRHKEPLLAAVAATLRPGGRFVLTVEEGPALTAAERSAMPAADTVWPVRLPALLGALERHGFEASSVEECTDSHRANAAALADAYAAGRQAIGDRIGHRAVDRLVAAHRLWVEWLGSGRIRKFGVVAVR
jgi:SAM-dependent methyltransferase